MLLRRLLKILHELGAVGTLGAYAICLVLAVTAPNPDTSLAGYAAVRASIAAVSKWILVPSLAAVTVSGLLAIAATPGYRDAGWAWVKALLGISVFEGSLLTVVASAKQTAALSAAAAAGTQAIDPVALAALVRTERGGLWLMIAVSLANVVLAVWRPRLTPRHLPD